MIRVAVPDVVVAFFLASFDAAVPKLDLHRSYP